MTISSENLMSLLPGPKNDIWGWKMTQETFYHRKNLYDYINGGAELYLSYGFQKLLNRMYSREGQPDIIVDVFHMGNSQNAFGVFTHSRESVEDSIGQGSQYTAGLLLFWKGSYYISILASPETEETRKAVHQIARIIESNITKTGPLPDILKHLPSENLDESSIRFFYHPIWQNTYYFITEENIFNLTEKSEAVLARYNESGILLLVKYPSAIEASAALSNFTRYFLPENPPGGIMQIEDGSWVGARISQNLLVAVFNSPSREATFKLLRAVS